MSHATQVSFVNIHGEPVNTSKRVKLEKQSRAPGQYHKGWVVEGIPPGALQEAVDAHKRVVARAENAGGAPIKPWNYESWLTKAKRKRVRTKAYEVSSAAEQCKALAEKAGWLQVEIRSLSRGAQ